MSRSLVAATWAPSVILRYNKAHPTDSQPWTTELHFASATLQICIAELELLGRLCDLTRLQSLAANLLCTQSH